MFISGRDRSDNWRHADVVISAMEGLLPGIMVRPPQRLPKQSGKPDQPFGSHNLSGAVAALVFVHRTRGSTDGGLEVLLVSCVGIVPALSALIADVHPSRFNYRAHWWQLGTLIKADWLQVSPNGVLIPRGE